AFAPDGAALLAAGARSPDFVYRLWDVERRTPHTTFTHAGGALRPRVAFAPDQKWVVVAGPEYDFLLFDPWTGKLLRRISTSLKTYPVDLSLSPDGRRIAWTPFGNSEVQLLELEEQRQAALPFTEIGRQALAVAFSPDGANLAATARAASKGGGGLRVWD